MVEKNSDFPYRMMDRCLTKEEMKYVEMPNQRKIRSSQVNNIYRALNDGKGFDTPLVINVCNGTKTIRIIDGGHRITAINKKMDDDSSFKIWVRCAVYDDLTQDQEREVYSKWNSGVAQNLDDFINAYKEEIPEYDNIIDEIPTSIYGSKEKIRLRFLVIAYLCSKQPQFNGYKMVHRYRRDVFIEQLKSLTYDDVSSMKNTFDILLEIFNQDDFIDFMRLPAFKFQCFSALYHLVANNKVTLGRNYVVKRMKTVLGRSAELSTFKNSSISSSIEVYRRCKYLLNKGTEKKFV